MPPPGRGRVRPLHTLTRRCLDWIRQLRTLTRRYVQLITAERLYLWLILLAPFLLGYFVRLSQTSQGLNVAGASNPSAEETLLVLMITASLAGVFNSIREVVKERGIYDRERAAGLSASAYLTSKVLVLGVIAIYQAVVMTAIGLLGYRLPTSGSLLTHHPFIELCAATALLELASTYLGLLVSALVPSSDLAMQVLIVPVMIQLVFSGGFFTLTGVFSQLSTLIPGRWGFAALASTAQLNKPNQAMGMPTDPGWAHTPSAWLIAMGAMLAWSAVYMLLAWWLLNRRSPGRRKKEWRQFPRWHFR